MALLGELWTGWKFLAARPCYILLANVALGLRERLVNILVVIGGKECQWLALGILPCLLLGIWLSLLRLVVLFKKRPIFIGIVCQCLALFCQSYWD